MNDDIDKEIEALDQEYRKIIGEDIDAEISDDKLQKLINKNEVDKSVPGGISPTRRQELIAEAENRLKYWTENLSSNDSMSDYLIRRIHMLENNFNAYDIDQESIDFAKENLTSIFEVAEDLTGTYHLKFLQICKMDNKDEAEKAIDKLATDSIIEEEKYNYPPNYSDSLPIPSENTINNGNENIDKSFFEKRPLFTYSIVISSMLLVAVLSMPYGYYRFLRIAVCFVSFIFSVGIFLLKSNIFIKFLGVIFLCTAILFNPFIKISFDRNIWQIIDIICALLFLITGFFLKDKPIS